MQILLILLAITVISCSSGPSLYVPYQNQQGYSDKTIDSNLRFASFQGNANTKKDMAQLYAKFRAIEICRDINKPYTHIMVVKDKSYSKNISQTSTTGPSYYYGMSPYYGRYGYGGMGMSYGTASTTTYNETYDYPMFEVYFECVDKALDARVALINLSASQMESLIKDLKGAVQVDEILPDSPNKNKLQKADIIYKANGERVGKVLDVYQAARKNMNAPLKIEFFRNGVKKEAVVSFIDVSAMVKEAQEEIVQKACGQEGIKELKKDVCAK